MAKFEFNKSAKKKSPKPITETKISKPKETYDPTKMTKQVEKDYQQERPKKQRRRRENQEPTCLSAGDCIGCEISDEPE